MTNSLIDFHTGAAHIETVSSALARPDAAALDADAERRADADAVSAAVRHSFTRTDVQPPSDARTDVSADASPHKVAVPPLRGRLRDLDAVQGCVEI